MKVASTADGITAIQADIKTFGLPATVIYECIDRASSATKPILQKMHECMPKHRMNTKSCWPVTKVLTIEPEKRRLLNHLGKIRLDELRTELGLEITEMEYCLYNIFAPSQAAMADCEKVIAELLENKVPELKFCGIYPAKIVGMRENGIEVKLYDTNRRTFIHSSMLTDNMNISNPAALGLSIGQTIDVKYFGPDPVDGFLRLARRGREFGTR